MGRTDDVLNVAGHRLSTGSIEAALAGHPDVAECAVIGVADDFKGQVPRGLVVLKGGVDGTRPTASGSAPSSCSGCATRWAPSRACSQVDIVAGLPKTRSGKILRKTMREMADGKMPTVPGTIEDASVLDALAPVLRPAPDARPRSASRRTSAGAAPALPLASAARSRYCPGRDPDERGEVPGEVGLVVPAVAAREVGERAVPARRRGR